MSLIRADARQIPLVDGCVQCCVTSPPYWGLRSYPDAKQIGLEPTPEAYVQTLVEVFREVRRVLKDDGTLWLNLGDSYASNAATAQNPAKTPGGFESYRGSDTPTLNTDKQGRIAYRGNGVKAKDLIGIPWRVAFALQQPYYTGSIRDERDRIWLAAMLDAEGCLFIHKRKAGQHNGQGYYRQNDNYGPGVEITNTSLAVVERVHALVCKGSICSQGPQENGRRKQRIYRWNLRTVECREFVRELYPYLVAKRQQSRILYGCPASGERAEAAHAALIALHRIGESGVDFPEPPPCLEPGWYLRSDVIWAKANPMPESVTDRPTKAHEYIFLLSKRASYYYDTDALREAYGENAERKMLSSRPSQMRHTHAAEGVILGRATAPNCGLYDQEINPLGRNKRSVWHVATQPYSEAHFATFPEKLIEPCILAGSRVGDLVLDPFIGSGTTGTVCERLMRRWVGTDLSYQPLAKRRTAQRGLRLEDVDEATA